MVGGHWYIIRILGARKPDLNAKRTERLFNLQTRC